MDGGENIKVVLRVRPFNDTERARGDRKVIEYAEDRRSVQICGGGMEDFGRSASIRNFSFNEVFDESCDQQMFFDGCGVKGLVSKALAGYSATLFAYGQTGSGKTYSVSGAEDVIVDEGYSGGDPQEGIVPRAVRCIFDEMSQVSEKKYVLKAACFEIYNEQVLDLLNPEAGQLQVRESRSQGFFVENLLVVECSGVADLMEVFKEGARNRHVGPHALNRDSSRSHSLLVLYLDGFFTDEETGEEVRQYGKLTFVDLAGSERLKYSGSSGEMLKETGSINRSLFTLGKVIGALDRQDKGEAFVPYRDSKLTKLLMDSLGGSASCIMVACCSPSLKYAEETLSTLHYASRAKNIRNRPTVQLDPQQRLIQQLRHDITALRAENSALRDALAGGVGAELAASTVMAIAPSPRPAMGLNSNPAATSGGMPRASFNRALSGSALLPPSSSASAVAAAASHQAAADVSGAGTTRMPLYEKAVGYAEGYAEGLQQAREALSSRGLDLAACLTQYDLSRSGGGAALGERHGSSRGSRLPPLDVGAQHLAAVGGGSASFRSSAAADSGRGSGASGSERTAEEYARETAALRAARAALEQRCADLERQCDALRRSAATPPGFAAGGSSRGAGAGGNSTGSGGGSRGGGTGPSPEAIIQQTRIDRLTAENAELKRMLTELLQRDGPSTFGGGGGGGYIEGGSSSGEGEAAVELGGGMITAPADLTPPAGAHARAQPAAQAASSRRHGGGGGVDGAAASPRRAVARGSAESLASGNSSSGRELGGQNRAGDGGLFCASEAALWAEPHWSDAAAGPRPGAEARPALPGASPAGRTPRAAGGGGPREPVGPPRRAQEPRGASVGPHEVLYDAAAGGGGDVPREAKRGAPSINRLK